MSEEVAMSADPPPNMMDQDVDNANNRPHRRNGGKRTPLSCLACRQHKLRCDRRVPCGTCIRYRREAQCRENPAPTRRRGAAATVLEQQRVEERLSYTGVAIGDSCQGVHSQESRPHSSDAGHAGRESGVHAIGPAGTANQPVSQGFASLARVIGHDVHMDGPPSSSLPQILAEANRVQQHPSPWWSFLEPDYQRRVWR